MVIIFEGRHLLLFIEHSQKKSFKTIAITSLSINMKTKMKKTSVFLANKFLKDKNSDFPF